MHVTKAHACNTFANSQQNYINIHYNTPPGENDGYMTMVYHGLPWTTIVFHGHITMVNHGRPCFVKWPPMVDHGQRSLSNNMVVMVQDHGLPWSKTMVDHV